MRHASWNLLALLASAMLAACAGAADWYVAVDGKAEANGTREEPLDLATAVGLRSPALPGDTIWIMAGTYRGGFVAELDGLSKAPITVRALPGERVTIDAASRSGSGLSIRGRHTAWRDLEVTCSDPRRQTDRLGRNPGGYVRPDGVTVRGLGIRVLDCIVHDCENGISLWTEARDTEVAGCVVYNNGWQGPMTGHGSGIRAQNRDGSKRIVGNVVFNQFAYGIYVHTDISHVKAFHVEGNVCFNNGSLTRHNERAANLFVGSAATPAEGITVVGNHAWHDHQTATTCQLGMGLENFDLAATDNTFVGLTRVMGWHRLTMSGNTFVGANTVVELHLPSAERKADYTWDRNRYWRGQSDWSPFAVYTKSSGGGLDWDGWRRQTGLDTGSTFRRERPTGGRVVVLPAEHSKRRAVVVVYNWDRKDEVEVPLNKVFVTGTKFRVLHAQDPFAEPILSGTFDGKPVALSTAGRPAAEVVGRSPSKPPVTGPLFNVWLVRAEERGPEP